MMTNILTATAGTFGWGPRWSEGAQWQFDDLIAATWTLFFLMMLLGLLVMAIRARQTRARQKQVPTPDMENFASAKIPLRRLTTADQNWILAGRMREQRLNQVHR